MLAMLVTNTILTYFRMKCVRITFKTSSDCSQPIDLVFQVISTTAAVTAVAELTIGKAVTVPEHRHTVTHTQCRPDCLH